MSFDLYAEYDACEHCGRRGDSHHLANATHNVNNMVEVMWAGIGLDLKGTEPDAGYVERSWGRLHGHRLADLKPLLVRALEWFGEHERELTPMNPSNGWGSTQCLHRVLRALLEAAGEHPKANVRACG